MEEIDPIYQGNFKYVCVPADANEAIVELEASKAGGLEKDALRSIAEEHFAASNSTKSISTSVEIVSLLLPSADYNFVGVSMYCDQAGIAKKLPINSRATSIASLAHHKDAIHGDVYFGKYHDDESKPWVRLDFSREDLSSDAQWLKIAQLKNAGVRSGAYSTSGVLQNMLKQGKTQYIDPSQEELTSSSPIEKSENGALTWTQSNFDIEIKVKVPGSLKSSDFDIKIKPNKLQIRLKSGREIPFAQEGKVSQLFEVGGAELFQKIDADSSSWEIEKAKDGQQTVIIFTLIKETSSQWLDLLAV